MFNASSLIDSPPSYSTTAVARGQAGSGGIDSDFSTGAINIGGSSMTSSLIVVAVVAVIYFYLKKKK